MTFFHSLAGILSLLLVVALGYALARRGWFGPDSRKLIPRLVTNISLPPFLACTIISSYPPDNILHILEGAFPPFIVLIVLFAGAWLAARLLSVQKRHFGLFCVCVSNPNTIYIGIPVNMALFGAESLPYVLLYYFASTLFFWTVGNYMIARDGTGAKKRFQWQKIVSPPLLGFLCGMSVILSGIKIPDFLFSAASLTGQMTMPLALIFIGIMLEEAGLAKLKPQKDQIAALAGRMVASPLIMWLTLFFFDLPPLMGKVFIIQSSLPVIAQVAILSAYYNTDPEFGSEMVALSTIFCAITIPVYMLLI